MNFKIESTPRFEKNLKRLVKKYPSLKKEIKDIISDIQINPTKGTPIRQNCYKIRIPIASKGKGKSGGARVITCVFLIEKSFGFSPSTTSLKKKIYPTKI